jgi:membrane associated rhomboid family serine protease
VLGGAGGRTTPSALEGGAAPEASGRFGQTAPAHRRRFPLGTAVVFVVNLLVGMVLPALQTLEWITEEKVLTLLGHERLKVWDGEYWRIVTSTFLHATPLHLAVNLAGLYLFGSVVEQWTGPKRFLVWYGLFGLSGALFFQAFSGLGLGVGASGAVFGLIGVFLVGRLGRRGQAGVVLGRAFWLGAAIAIGLSLVDVVIATVLVRGARVAISAHLGGLLAGFLMGYRLFSARGEAGRRRRLRTGLLGAAALVAVGVYGLAAPVLDWSWHLWRMRAAADGGDEAALRSLYDKVRRWGGDDAGVQILELEVKRGRLAQALAYWEVHPLEDEDRQREAGYVHIYGALYERDRIVDAPAFLNKLIALADKALDRERSAQHLNECAWFRALSNEDLGTALRYASEAVDLNRLSAYVNTLGWVEFLMGDLPAAGRHLREAVELGGPGGENHLYLALFYFAVERRQDARKAAEEARRRGLTLRHEIVLLEELEDSL